MNDGLWTMRCRSRRPAREDGGREVEGRAPPPDRVVPPLPVPVPVGPGVPDPVGSSTVGPSDVAGRGVLAGRPGAGFVPGRWRRRLALLTWLPRVSGRWMTAVFDRGSGGRRGAARTVRVPSRPSVVPDRAWRASPDAPHGSLR